MGPSNGSSYSECPVTQVSPQLALNKFLSANTPGFLGGHYVLPKDPAKIDPKIFWIKTKSILGDTYFVAAKSGGRNIICLSYETPTEDEPAADEPNYAQARQ